ncbi:hypothetical protein [Pelosinus sp. sgz500959]|uniref:hypothetical protein n=1 Tax=Pelosinus sp. sgz500959 TaxID=3242472 RepID=UPI00366BC0B7
MMKRFLIGLLYENGAASRTGLAALLLILLPMLVLLVLTGYMIVAEKDFVKYDSYIGAAEWLITVGTGLLGYNKTITLKNNGGNQ